jgi:radial spoke head protein 4A
VYWVTNNVLNAWTKLPDLNPSDIKASRNIKVLFSGNLDRKIYTNPFFFGLEKHYLRAQIARISFSTTIMPIGLFKLTEDNEREIEDNVPEEGEIQMPSTMEMSRPENWVHNTPNILEAARVAHLDPEVPEGAPDDLDPEVLKKELEARDPYQPRLKPIVKDQLLDVAEGAKQSAWVVKLMGDKSVYQSLTNPKTSVSYGVVVVKSLQWPGSLTFYHQGKYSQIYVGDGHKYETQSYYPVLPPRICEDPEELVEMSEPNPSEAPVVEEAPVEGDEAKEENQEEDEQ